LAPSVLRAAVRKPEPRTPGSGQRIMKQKMADLIDQVCHFRFALCEDRAA
jgi:hypothetical protein